MFIRVYLWLLSASTFPTLEVEPQIHTAQIFSGATSTHYLCSFVFICGDSRQAHFQHLKLNHRFTQMNTDLFQRDFDSLSVFIRVYLW